MRRWRTRRSRCRSGPRRRCKVGAVGAEAELTRNRRETAGACVAAVRRCGDVLVPAQRRGATDRGVAETQSGGGGGGGRAARRRRWAMGSRRPQATGHAPEPVRGDKSMAAVPRPRAASAQAAQPYRPSNGGCAAARDTRDGRERGGGHGRAAGPAARAGRRSAATERGDGVRRRSTATEHGDGALAPRPRSSLSAPGSSARTALGRGSAADMACYVTRRGRRAQWG